MVEAVIASATFVENCQMRGKARISSGMTNADTMGYKCNNIGELIPC